MASSGWSESTVEQAALDWFEALGYAILQGPDIAPGEASAERSDFGEVFLKRRLHEALARLNPNVPESALDEALRKVTRTETPSLAENNRRFHWLLTDGVDVEYRRAEWGADGSRFEVF